MVGVKKGLLGIVAHLLVHVPPTLLCAFGKMVHADHDGEPRPSCRQSWPSIRRIDLINLSLSDIKNRTLCFSSKPISSGCFFCIGFGWGQLGIKTLGPFGALAEDANLHARCLRAFWPH